MQVDRDDSGRGYLDLAVHPDLRGQGFGTAVLSAFLSGPGRAYAILEGRIAPDNAASIAASALSKTNPRLPSHVRKAFREFELRSTVQIPGPLYRLS
ncbi:GNAT family N-acetyltransferase [Rhizobium laguerreae]|uniref:GNAT family N-acetyltransferase n=1 Tax=Rhizobium laguerreae TaxID=1076926 RepID=UPI00370451AF